jgi:hypothetical protein
MYHKKPQKRLFIHVESALKENLTHTEIFVKELVKIDIDGLGVQQAPSLPLPQGTRK